MADIAFRAGEAGSDTSFTSATDTATVPAGTAAGDGMVIGYFSGVVSGGGSPTHTTPSGWDANGTATGTSGGLDIRHTVYARYAGAGEGGTTLTSSANSAHAWQRASYTGADPAYWLASDITTQFGTTASGTTHTLPSVTTTHPRQLVVYEMYASSAGITYTAASGTTERLDANAACYADLIQVSVGSVGTKDFTSSSTTTVRYSVSVYNPDCRTLRNHASARARMGRM